MSRPPATGAKDATPDAGAGKEKTPPAAARDVPAPAEWLALAQRADGAAPAAAGEGASPRLRTTTPALRREPDGAAAPAGAAPVARTLLVEDDAAPGPGQMARRAFLDRLRTAACAGAEEALAGSLWSVAACPYIERAFTRMEGYSAARLERGLRTYAPETAGAASAEDYLPAVQARVRTGVARWRETGEVAGLPPELMGGDAATEPPGALETAGGLLSGLFRMADGPAAPGVSVDPAGVGQALGPGRPVDAAVRAPLERAMGTSFAGVRVHDGEAAASLSTRLGARAFALGDQVAFGRGQYRPGTLEGDALLAHELAHVAQQGGSAPRAGERMEVRDDPAVEADADRAAVGAVMRMRGLDAGTAPLPLARARLGLRRCGDGCSPAPPAPAPAPAPPVPAHPPYATADLQAKVDGADTADAIAAWIRTLAPADVERATADLQGMRVSLQSQLDGDESLRPTLEPKIQKADDALHTLYGATAALSSAGVGAPPGGRWAAGSIPPSLLAGTHALSAADRARVGPAMSPVATVGGVAPTFRPTIPGQPPYDTRIRNRISAWITAHYASNVAGKGPTEHADPTKTHSLPRFQEIGNAARDEVNAVFGSYAQGPSFSPGVNLFDAWEQYDRRVWGTPGVGGVRTGAMNAAGRRDLARDLISYALNADSDPGGPGVAQINAQHGAVPTRTTPPPTGGDPEATRLDRIRDHFASTQETRLLEIDRGWPATAGGGRVNFQLWRAPTDDGNRRIFWDAFQTFIHEYLHTLAHPDYEAYADTFGYDAPEYNTLMEGVDSLLTEIAWRQVSGRASAPALRARVEGAAFAALPWNAALVPPITNQRYPSYSQALALVDVVGIRNLYAAYFLGRVDLIRG